MVDTNDTSELPKHVAIIMDGNGRWARARDLARIYGHQEGGENVRRITVEARKQGIRYLTLYAFSSENWSRPEDEVQGLMKLFSKYLNNELKTFTDNNVRFRVIGDRSRLSDELCELIESLENQTQQYDGMQLVIAVSYGSREEILQAMKGIAQKVKDGSLTPSELTEQTICDHLYAPDIPDPDLLVRTSGECRISNFLLWQLAYSEIILSPLYWPDFNEDAFRECLKEYASRERRYGLTGEQVTKEL